MKDTLTCGEIQELVLEMRHGETSQLTDTWIHEHLETCATCREFTNKLTDMIDTAEQLPWHQWASIDADDLFDRIEAAVATPGSSKSSEYAVYDDEAYDALDDDVAATSDTAVDESADSDGDEVVAPRRGLVGLFRRGARVAAAVAATAALGAGVFFAPRLLASRRMSHPERVAANKARARHVPPVITATKTKKDIPDGQLPPLRAEATPAPFIRLFASDGAQWNYVGADSAHPHLMLKRGVVMVEFLPGASKSFAVITRQRTVKVEGTIFYVAASAHEHSVGVLAGKVQVTPHDKLKPAVQLKAGRFLGNDGAVRALPKVTFKQASQYVDIQAHLRALKRLHALEAAAARRARQNRHRRPARANHAIGHAVHVAANRESVRELREDADRSLQDGSYRHAAHLMSQALRRLPASDARTAPLLLDLARIHLRHLGEPAQARMYLERFLKWWPHDVAAPAARAELCHLAGSHTSNPACAAANR